MFHKTSLLTPLSSYRLLAVFETGERKEFDMKPPIEHTYVFKPLAYVPKLFELARIDVGGYGLCWNEDIDLSTEAVWYKGKDNP